jgi:hypothetical protein
MENKNLGVLVHQEDELKKLKNELEAKALQSLCDWLDDQAQEMDNNADKIISKSTPFTME